MKFSLSPGHALCTSGKQTPDGMKEWEFNAAVVKYLIDGLENYENVQVLRLDDPTGKRDIPLQTRSDKANKWCADVHIDVHANAAGPGGWYDAAKGIETFVYSSKPKEALDLAQKVQANLVSATKLQNRGVKAADFHMLRETHMTAILVEAGFMTNRTEATLLKSDNYRRTVAGAILDALVSQYGLKKKVKSSVENSSSVKIQTGGLNPEMVKEISDFFIQNKWYAEITFNFKNGNPTAMTGGLSAATRDKFESWLKERGWWYKVIK